MTPWPEQDLTVHARAIRRAVRKLDRCVPEIADLLDPLLEVADSLDAIGRPIVVTREMSR